MISIIGWLDSLSLLHWEVFFSLIIIIIIAVYLQEVDAWTYNNSEDITTQIYLIGAAITSFYLLQVKEIHCNAYGVDWPGQHGIIYGLDTINNDWAGVCTLQNY